MPRRVSLPAADELFRTTGGAAVQPSTPSENATSPGGDHAARVPAPAGERGPAGDEPDPSPEEARTPAQRGQAAAGREQAVPGQPKREQPSGRAASAAPAKSGRAAAGSAAGQRKSRAARRPSGRERHDEKITVYVSAEELMDLEQARLVLRGEHGLAVDRGRIVREAVAVVLADLESRGDASILVRRLRGR
ncbi:hypothetical protein RM780_25565 [Streptomyces sp. DSM 44917]|uniref:Cobyrinic acid a,c-diamide synthase n=1 Tax=Streptomyces boetiae TaxID=3075541 RepID=A0ABU2LFD7_9ACTN|nr:hypothetical protein [Streptomyces sp. DSM 44917]MDT0310291.1 hypothetical protein [Streptomyces sp. DSM 44917]